MLIAAIAGQAMCAGSNVVDKEPVLVRIKVIGFTGLISNSRQK
jgi:hypothetical protein